MNIFYNFELDDEIELMVKKPEIIIYLKELKAFVKSRLTVLEKEIDKEEEISTKMVVLYLAENNTQSDGIMYIGYSKALRTKMNSCISVKDVEYLKARLSYIFDRLN
jgi:hypothetical protein